MTLPTEKSTKKKPHKISKGTKRERKKENKKTDVKKRNQPMTLKTVLNAQIKYNRAIH